MCVPAFSHAHTYTHTHTVDGRENAGTVILSTITAGLLEEWTPITANQTEPNTALVHQPLLHPATAAPDTPFLSAWLCCIPFGHSCTMASHVLQMG